MFQHPGMQQRPDGAGHSAEKPVNAAAQGLHQSLSPLDPFVDTASEHRFNHSGLSLFGDEGNTLYSFGAGGHAKQSVMNQMQPPHQFEPAASGGYNPHSGSFRQPPSHGHSIAPPTPMMGDRLQLGGYSVPPTPLMHLGSPPFHNTMQRHDNSIHQSMQNNFQQLLTEMQKINTRLNHIESTNQTILENQAKFAEHVQKNEEMLKELQDGLGEVATASTAKSIAGKKNVSNLHPALKVSRHLPSLYVPGAK